MSAETGIARELREAADRYHRARSEEQAAREAFYALVVRATETMTYREIAAAVGISPTRITQLMRAAEDGR